MGAFSGGCPATRAAAGLAAPEAGTAAEEPSTASIEAISATTKTRIGVRRTGMDFPSTQLGPRHPNWGGQELNTAAQGADVIAGHLSRRLCGRRTLGHMSVRRIMGTETEFGISVAGHPHANPMVASTRLVNAYATATLKARRARWDFEEESPLRDARGFDMSRQIADPTQLTDEDLGLANVILTNGARLYVDHAHPEYSTPEVTTPRDIVKWDKAGEQVMLDAARRAGQLPGGSPIVCYKNNTDNKGASYGAHENYLMRRATPFADIVRHLTPFFVSRQVIV